MNLRLIAVQRCRQIFPEINTEPTSYGQDYDYGHEEQGYGHYEPDYGYEAHKPAEYKHR